MTNAVERLTASMADHLESAADLIVESWIDWIEAHYDSRTIRGLPRRAIRNHIPPVLRHIAAYVREPTEAVRGEMSGHLELHGALRRGQGYSLDELLVEHDTLARMVTGSVRDFFEANPGDYGVHDVIEGFDRLTTGLRLMAFGTIRAYRDREKEQRRRLSECLEEFARTIAHELRSPLQAAYLGVQLIREGPTDPARFDRQVEVIENSLRRSTDLIDNLRELALIEGGRGRDVELGRVQRLVQEALEEIAPVARERQVDLRIAGQVPDVALDAMTFQLALVNVAINAVKYSDPEKPERHVTISFEQLAVEGDVDQLVVRVADNGLGIGPEYVNRVFQRQVRAHPEVADGTGLGLPITRQLLLERGGDIDLQSEPGVGTTVTFELPCYPAGTATPK